MVPENGSIAINDSAYNSQGVNVLLTPQTYYRRWAMLVILVFLSTSNNVTQFTFTSGEELIQNILQYFSYL